MFGAGCLYLTIRKLLYKPSSGTNKQTIYIVMPKLFGASRGVSVSSLEHNRKLIFSI